jgi:hypothetical protein
MGYSERKRHAMVAMMHHATFKQRVLVWLSFVGQAQRPPKVRGWAGLRWVLTGKTEGRT